MDDLRSHAAGQDGLLHHLDDVPRLKRRRKFPGDYAP